MIRRFRRAAYGFALLKVQLSSEKRDFILAPLTASCPDPLVLHRCHNAPPTETTGDNESKHSFSNPTDTAAQTWADSKARWGPGGEQRGAWAVVNRRPVPAVPGGLGSHDLRLQSVPPTTASQYPPQYEQAPAPAGHEGRGAESGSPATMEENREMERTLNQVTLTCPTLRAVGLRGAAR